MILHRKKSWTECTFWMYQLILMISIAIAARNRICEY